MLEDYAALIRAGEVWVLAGEAGGEVIGVLVMRPAEDHLFVGNVAVAPGHQGRGLGRELVAFAEQRAEGAWPRDPAVHEREDVGEPRRLREAGLRGDPAQARRGLPGRVLA